MTFTNDQEHTMNPTADLGPTIQRMVTRRRAYTAPQRRELEVAARADAAAMHVDERVAGRSLNLEALIPDGQAPEPFTVAVEAITGRSLPRDPKPNPAAHRAALKRWAIRERRGAGA